MDIDALAKHIPGIIAFKKKIEAWEANQETNPFFMADSADAREDFAALREFRDEIPALNAHLKSIDEKLDGVEQIKTDVESLRQEVAALRQSVQPEATATIPQPGQAVDVDAVVAAVLAKLGLDDRSDLASALNKLESDRTDQGEKIGSLETLLLEQGEKIEAVGALMKDNNDNVERLATLVSGIADALDGENPDLGLDKEPDAGAGDQNGATDEAAPLAGDNASSEGAGDQQAPLGQRDPS